jgi:hypothetical protein
MVLRRILLAGGHVVRDARVLWEEGDAPHVTANPEKHGTATFRQVGEQQWYKLHKHNYHSHVHVHGTAKQAACKSYRWVWFLCRQTMGEVARTSEWPNPPHWRSMDSCQCWYIRIGYTFCRHSLLEDRVLGAWQGRPRRRHHDCVGSNDYQLKHLAAWLAGVPGDTDRDDV